MKEFVDFLVVFGGLATLTGAVLNFIFLFLAGRQDANMGTVIKSLDKVSGAIENLGLRLDSLGGRIDTSIDLRSKEVRGSLDSLTAAIINR